MESLRVTVPEICPGQYCGKIVAGKKKNNEANWMVSNSAKLDRRTKQHTQFGISTSDGSRDMARTKVAEKKEKKNEHRQNYIASPTGIANKADKGMLWGRTIMWWPSCRYVTFVARCLLCNRCWSQLVPAEFPPVKKKKNISVQIFCKTGGKLTDLDAREFQGLCQQNFDLVIIFLEGD